jgi:1-acyl-sn-glycerol-3-phosphate acyltransferase
MLKRDECVMAFPEGVRGMNKLYADAYQLQEFGLGFMRLALETDTPIVPVAVVGSEEQAPAIANLEGLGRIFGMPAFPITITWPWLGPLGMIPWPVRYHIEFGAPMRFRGDPNDEDEIVEEKVEEVKSTIQSMLRKGLAERRSIFL